ncbi:MAG: TIGR01777 family oxidoreductase [Chitinophagales bacterium]
MQNILITGGSGFIGRKLSEVLLANGYNIAWLGRKKPQINNIKTFLWNTDAGTMEEGAIKWADAIIHLSGENISEKRWTKNRKKQIIGSRVKSASVLRKYLEASGKKMQAIIAASAIGYYGDRKNEILFEESKPGTGFLSESCVSWENATQQLQNFAERFITFRIGIVLDETGGAMKELTKTFPFGIAPVLGSGKQTYSWIMLGDVCRMFMFALQNKTIQGVYNSVAPQPVSQKELMKQILIKQKRKAILFPVPAFVLKIMLGKMAAAVLIDQHVSCKKILDAGFQFENETIIKK